MKVELVNKDGIEVLRILKTKPLDMHIDHAAVLSHIEGIAGHFHQWRCANHHLVTFGELLVIAIDRDIPDSCIFNFDKWAFINLPASSSSKDLIEAFIAVVDAGFKIIVGSVLSARSLVIKSIEELFIKVDLHGKDIAYA